MMKMIHDLAGNNLSKRILAVLLCLLMTFIPSVSVLADTETETSEETEASETEETISESPEELMTLEDVKNYILKQKPATRKVADTDETIYNLLMIGVDRQNENWNGNSDAMILMTINFSCGMVMMTSFMRDTRVTVPGYGQRKLNAACALGGADLLAETLRQNFGVRVDSWVWIDFNHMMELIDTLGGIDIELTPSEAAFLDISIPATQVVHLDGTQTLRHARDRFSSGNDQARTQRQRDILMALLNKFRSGTLGDMAGVLNIVLNYVHHNIPANVLTVLLLSTYSILNYSFDQQRVPYEGLYGYENQDLILNFPETRRILRETLHIRKKTRPCTYSGRRAAIR